jgi:phosphoribulokinase
MIQPRPQKPHANHDRRRDHAQAFVQVGAVLFRHMMHPLRQAVAQRGVDRIQITDHGVRHMTQGMKMICPPVCRDRIGGQRKCRVQGHAVETCTAGQGHPTL